MNIWTTVIVCFLAGAGAGIGTGFAGMSAAAVVSPLLMTFLDIPAYQAIGIGLASDVLASAVSALTYKKHGNLDVENSLVMMVAVLVMTVAGSCLASFLPERTMGNTVIVAMIILGLRFIFKPIMTTKEQMQTVSPAKRRLRALLGGTVVGFICGFVGAGGGMMMLFVLTSVLGYELHMAVGTSVFIMAFTALTGSVSHFIIGDLPDPTCLVLCVAFTLIWARIAAKIANHSRTIVLNRVVGAVLLVTSFAIVLVELL